MYSKFVSIHIVVVSSSCLGISFVEANQQQNTKREKNIQTFKWVQEEYKENGVYGDCIMYGYGCSVFYFYFHSALQQQLFRNFSSFYNSLRASLLNESLN